MGNLSKEKARDRIEQIFHFLAFQYALAQVPLHPLKGNTSERV